MSEFVSRQFSGLVIPTDTVNTPTDPSSSQVYLWQLTDVPLKYILRMASEGLVSHDYINIAASTTETLALPNEYVNTQRLFVALRAADDVRVVVASPNHATSTVVLKTSGAGGSAAQNGIITMVDTITSITVFNGHAGAVAIEYFMFQYPDITRAAGWRIGSQATGVQDT